MAAFTMDIAFCLNQLKTEFGHVKGNIDITTEADCKT